MEWLEPKFEEIPPELINIDRWVIWRDKVPFNAKTKKKADCTDPTQWESFELAKSTYENGGFDGIGFVLNNDGIIGIDLDRCVVDGKPSEEAEKLLEGLNVGYIELSPSGNGLHAFGYGRMLSGRKTQIDGLHVEIYPNKRYLTVTGHILKKGLLRPLTGLESVLHRMDGLTEDTEVTEETDRGSSVSSVSSVSESTKWPKHVIPTGYGQRRTKIFELARWLKGTEPEASNARQKDLLRQWYLDYRHIFKTQEFEASWADWINGWHRVKYPYGKQLQAAIQALPPLPPHLENEDLHAKEKHLLQICIALQARESEGCPFFISCRKAGELIDIDHTSTASLLSSFVIRGYLELVEKGKGKRASRYKFKISEGYVDTE